MFGVQPVCKMCDEWTQVTDDAEVHSRKRVYTLHPFEALTPEDKPFEPLGHRDEAFRMERGGNSNLLSH